MCLLLFLRMPLEKAAVWSMLGAYMLLPSDFEVKTPILPPIDKMGIAALSTVLLCWMKGSQVPYRRQSLLVYFFGAAYIIAPVLSSLNNSYELVIGPRSIPGFYPLDGIKFAGRNILALIPFYIGTRFLSTEAGRLQLVKAIPTAMLFYSLAMLFELRMSPQLHQWVYGFFPSNNFAQQMRAGGFRPVVFFPHGLALAMFTALTLILTLVLGRGKARILQISADLVAVYFSGLLLLCKSLGPVIYAVVLAPLVLFTKPRTWTKVALAACLIVCLYPALKSHDLTPDEAVSNIASKVSADREASFQTRLVNQNQLLAKANQKPYFGWGAWGRNRLYDQWTGKDVSITDSGAIIEYGLFGWFGYLALFGFLTAAIYRTSRIIGLDGSLSNLTRGALSLLVAVSMLDDLPNSEPLSLTFLLAGAAAGLAGVRVSNKAVRVSTLQTRSAAVPMPVT